MQKPILKTHTIKIQPIFSGDYSDQHDQYEQSKLEPIDKIIKLRITRSKISIPPRQKTIEDQSVFLASDHILGRGFISLKVFYLYLLKGQDINTAEWIQAHELSKKTKSASLIYTLFEARLISNSRILSCKKKPFIDVDYIQNYLSLKDKTKRSSLKSLKKTVQQLQAQFIYDFQVKKFKITGVQQVCNKSRSISKNFEQIPQKTFKKKQSTLKNVIKIQDEQGSTEQSISKASDSQFTFSQRKLRKSTNRQKKQSVIINDSTSDSLDTLSSKQISFSLSQKNDLTKEEITGVNYMGRIKENCGNYQNLYRFSLKYHPDIYSTMKIIKDDDFLRDAFIRYAEPLYEQVKKSS